MKTELSKLQSRLARWVQDIEREQRQVWVGLKEQSELAAVQAKHADLFTKPQIAAARTLTQQAAGDAAEIADRLLIAIEDGYIYAQLASDYDQLQTKLLQTKVAVDGEEIGYFDLQPQWSREDDFDRRERLADAFISVHQSVLPDQQALIERQLQIAADQLDHSDYTIWCEQTKRFDLRHFRDLLLPLGERLQPVYAPAMRQRVEERLGREFGELRSLHTLYLRGVSPHDDHFPARQLEPSLRKTLAAMGIDLAKLSNIHIDTEDRPKKNPRAVCFVINPPQEVHLVIKPTAGIIDYQAFFHEAGHALHFGLLDAKLPAAMREFPRSNAEAEIFSYQFENLIYTPAWLSWAMGLTPELAYEVAAEQRLNNLFQLVRYIAKLDYELEFYQHPTNWDVNAGIYAEKLTAATQFRYPRESYLFDMDADFYSADYLRAWVTQAQLREYLQSEFGQEWFTNPQAGNFFKDLWKEGTKPENEEISKRIGATPLDTGALQRFYEELL